MYGVGIQSVLGSRWSVNPDTFTHLLASGRSYKAISQELKTLYPRGLSERSIRTRTLADQDVFEAVKDSVSEVGC